MNIFRIASVVSVFLMMVGCAGTPISISKTSPTSNELQTAGVGDVFFSKEEMNGEDNGFGSVFNGNAYKFDLTVVSASETKIALEYNEYMKPIAGEYGGYRKDEAWLIKDKFTKRFDYELADSNKTISYKKYKFKIAKVNDGQIEYMRIE